LNKVLSALAVTEIRLGVNKGYKQEITKKTNPANTDYNCICGGVILQRNTRLELATSTLARSFGGFCTIRQSPINRIIQSFVGVLILVHFG